MKIRILLMIFLIVSLFILAACSRDDNTPAEMSGKYVIVEITDDPDEANYADLAEIYREMDLNLEDYMYMEFSDDGEFILILFGEEEVKGTYTRDGKNLTIKANGETVNTILDGKKIVWTYESGANLVFEKK